MKLTGILFLLAATSALAFGERTELKRTENAQGDLMLLLESVHEGADTIMSLTSWNAGRDEFISEWKNGVPSRLVMIKKEGLIRVVSEYRKPRAGIAKTERFDAHVFQTDFQELETMRFQQGGIAHSLATRDANGSFVVQREFTRPYEVQR
jgi:hypothetical protein